MRVCDTCHVVATIDCCQQNSTQTKVLELTGSCTPSSFSNALRAEVVAADLPAGAKAAAVVRIEERMASFIFVVAVVDDSIRMIEKINGHEKGQALVCWLGFDAQQAQHVNASQGFASSRIQNPREVENNVNVRTSTTCFDFVSLHTC